MPRIRNSAGGAAMQGGADYQNRVAAWIATKMLGERDGRPIAPPGTVTYLRSETREAIDDLLVATDQDNYGFIQTKRRLPLSSQPTSELASVFSQCVRQFLHPEEPDLRPGSRPLRPEHDKLPSRSKCLYRLIPKPSFFVLAQSCGRRRRGDISMNN